MKKIINRLKEHPNIEYVLFGSIPILVRDRLTNQIDINQLINSIHTLLPKPPKDLIKSIQIGNYSEFDQKKINAMYHDGILYLSNQQDDINDIMDDIVHEYSHALEEYYNDEIYGDTSIEKEFLSKREQLARIIKSQGFDITNYDFNNASYNKKLDIYLLDVIGYERLNKLTNYGLFINPYAATSLREYFATGFEEYILGDHTELQKISPILYNKIRELTTSQRK